MILVEMAESSVYVGIMHVSLPSFLCSDSEPSQRIEALAVQRSSGKVLPAF